MTRDEILNFPGHEPPVLCADGKVGLLTVFPGTSTQCGVQVHGEPEHRWLECGELHLSQHGALRQIGAPETPFGGDMVQEMLALSWRLG